MNESERIRQETAKAEAEMLELAAKLQETVERLVAEIKKAVGA